MAELLLGRDAEGQIIGQIRELNGEQGATAIEATVRSARMLHTDFGWDPFFRKEPGAEFPTGSSQRR